LEKGGFQIVRVEGDHAFLYCVDMDKGASVPLTPKTLPVGTIASVLRQAGLKGDDLRRLLGRTRGR